MSTDTITGTVTGVTLASGGAYGDPVTIAYGAEIDGSPAVRIVSPWTVVNYGTVSGGPIGIQVSTASSGYTEAWITNAAGATITATGNGAGIAASGAVSIDNSGLIYNTVRGLSLAGGAVTNAATGTIAGGSFGIIDSVAAVTIVNDGTISGAVNDAIRLVNYSGAGVSLIDNGGTILGQGNNGIYISQSYAAVQNRGTIDSVYTDGIKTRGQSITVQNSGSIHGGTDGVDLGGVNATLENSGTISGTVYAAYLNGTGNNRLILDPGAAFSGQVLARSGAANTIELAGTSAGTLAGLGSTYVGFQTVTIDGGAKWDVAGTLAGFNGTTIQGFGNHDRLDLTDLAFDAGDTVTLDNGTDLLTIRDSGGTVLATIQLDGGVTGDLFKLVSDGHGGTFAEESDYTPCFCRGTLIRTPSGDRPVEDLRIGDPVMTEGGPLPLKWIGRRSYRGWPAVGNQDAQPILFKAGALAHRVPARDLRVSPEHAMLVDGMLIPACRLANGVSIVKMQGVEDIDYFHLEFDSHAVIFAEGAATESFVDDDSRMLFHNAGEYRRLYPDEPPRRAEFCAPRVESGTALDAVRRMLAARAAILRPDGTVPPRDSRGHLDVAGRTWVSGWAFGAGGEPQALAILVNGAVVGRVVADRYRADLKAAGIGDGRHGFSFALPGGLSPDIVHRIEVRREADWSLL